MMYNPLLFFLTIWFFGSLVIILLMSIALVLSAWPALRKRSRRSWWWSRLYSLRWYAWPDLLERLHCQRCWQHYHLVVPQCWVTQICSRHHSIVISSASFSRESEVRAAIAASVPQREVVEA